MNDPFDLVARHDELAELDPAARRLALRSLLHRELPGGEAPSVIERVANAIDAYGPLTKHMTDPGITDVLINGPADVWIERRGRLLRSDVVFATPGELETFVQRLAIRANIRVDASYPVADGRLPDGSRLHVVLPPLAPNGPAVSIRRFPQRSFGLNDLRERDMLAPGQLNLLLAAVEKRRSIAISGGTGTGKTTLLNALLSEVRPGERVIVVEETRELRPSCPHWVCLLSRPANVEGSGEVTLDELLRASLRMRPDRIVVGEIRGPEAHTALAAMSVGHAGSMVTVHARSSHDVVDRFVSLALTHQAARSEKSLRGQVTGALDLVVHLDRDEGGRRKVTELTELR